MTLSDCRPPLQRCIPAYYRAGCVSRRLAIALRASFLLANDGPAATLLDQATAKTAAIARRKMKGSMPSSPWCCVCFPFSVPHFIGSHTMLLGSRNGGTSAKTTLLASHAFRGQVVSDTGGNAPPASGRAVKRRLSERHAPPWRRSQLLAPSVLKTAGDVGWRCYAVKLGDRRRVRGSDFLGEFCPPGGRTGHGLRRAEQQTYGCYSIWNQLGRILRAHRRPPSTQRRPWIRNGCFSQSGTSGRFGAMHSSPRCCLGRMPCTLGAPACPLPCPPRPLLRVLVIGLRCQRTLYTIQFECQL